MHLDGHSHFVHHDDRRSNASTETRDDWEEASYLCCFLFKKKQSIQYNNRQKRFKKEKFPVEI